MKVMVIDTVSKVMIIDTVLDELKKMNEKDGFVSTQLYGLKIKKGVIVASSEEKKGLARVGVFCRKGNESTAVTLEIPIALYLDEEQLNCVSLARKAVIETLPVEVINYADDFENRRKGIVDDSQLKGKTVLVVGLGSGGSALLLDLVRCGVKKIIVIEFDHVSISNIGRSLYDLIDVGRDKTEVIYEKAVKINPYVEIEVYNEDITEMDIAFLRTIISNSDLIAECTDDVKTKRLVNGLAHDNTPVLYPGVYPYGKGGDILFTLPGEPCFECVFGPILKEASKQKKREWDYLTGQPKPIPALIADIQVVVARTVKLALGILTGDSENSFIENITEPGCTLLMIGNERGVSVFEDNAFGEVWVNTEINPKCICQTLR